MINYQYFSLDNGLRVYVHEDKSTPLAVVNLLYNVGSRDENPEMTGFAHLFEHLMFGGSQNIPSYDTPLQKAGAENNAFTSPDITNYYIQIPANNIETAFWLESDRMMALSFDQNVLDVQKKVVIEEFKQRYLNQPYGDVWLKLRDLAYTVHPYKWPTIGKEIEHIEKVQMKDVIEFFYTHYVPNNAILVVGGNVTLEQIKQLSQKWFGNIKPGKISQRNLPKEPIQKSKRTQEVFGNVPVNAIYKAWHMCDRLDDAYYATDLLSDIIGRGHSSRLYQQLVKEQKIFSNVQSYIMGSIDNGLLVIEGKLNDDISFERAESSITEVISHVKYDVLDNELVKVKNQAETSIILSETELLSRCMNLAFGANMGNPDLANQEGALIQKVTDEQLKNITKTVLTDENSNVLYYHKKNKN
ncbi:MAG: pitrilysin family protein [Bacteroidota bacterium]|nr:pitrilysin family protein [Bacteroidota bacterium]